MLYALCKRSYDVWVPAKADFIFDKCIEVPTEEEFQEAYETLQEVCDVSDADDVMIFTGPTWLVALAGYFWCTRECSQTLDLMTFDKRRHAIVTLRGKLES